MLVVVAPGIEQLAMAELHELGVGGRPRPIRGGVEVELTTRQLYVLHRWARLPTRLLVRVASAPARTFEDLEALVAAIDWSPFLRPGAPVDVRASSTASRLYHEGAIVERAARVLGRELDRAGGRVQVRIERNRATVSIDATGAPLHQRGWRSESSRPHAAPLRATLAAAMLRAAGYTGGEPLVDPMTGSGTIAVEAASTALGRPSEREFALRTWPSFEPGTWASATAAPPPRRPDACGPILAADRDAGAVQAAGELVAAADVGELVRVEHAPLRAQQWPEDPALVVCNPPYGRRVGGPDLRDLYAALGARVQRGGHRLCLLAADDRLARATGTPLETVFATSNGGIPVRCWMTPAAG